MKHALIRSSAALLARAAHAGCGERLVAFQLAKAESEKCSLLMGPVVCVSTYTTYILTIGVTEVARYRVDMGSTVPYSQH